MVKRKSADNSVADINSIIPAEVVDEHTGEVITAADAEKRLVFLEQQVAFGAVQMALALKEIKDGKLYLYIGYDNMKDYVEDRLPLSIRTVERYLQIANALNEKALTKFAGTPLNLLIEISRNEDLREEANSEDGDGEDIVKKARELEKKKYEKRINEYKEIIDGKETLLQNLKEKSQEIISRKDEEIGKLKETVQSMAASEGIDPDRLVFITQKQEAISLIENILTSTLRQLGDISNIPHGLMDAELAGRLTYAVSAIKAGIGRIEDAFFIELKPANENISVIPE